MINNLTEWRMENGERGRENKNSPFPIPHSAQKGFTLIETMVALSVLLISVVGPISLIGNSLHNIYYARDQVVAINLAQEGVELVRRVRDTNKLSGLSWNADIDVPGCYIVDSGKVDASGFVSFFGLAPCSPQQVYSDGTMGLYRQGSIAGATTSQFSRIVKIDSVPSNADEMKVTSTVTWKTGNTAGTITVADHLFNLTAL